jgi:hypothetical protein
MTLFQPSLVQDMPAARLALLAKISAAEAALTIIDLIGCFIDSSKELGCYWYCSHF